MQKVKSSSKLPNGEAVREFYLSLALIQEYYYEKGYRKKAYLYRTLKKKLGWKMSLESFKYHFRKAFNETSNIQKSSPDIAIEKDINKEHTLQEHEPKVAIIECKTITKIKKNTRAKRESIG